MLTEGLAEGKLKRLTEKKEDGQKIILAILIDSLSSVRFFYFLSTF